MTLIGTEAPEMRMVRRTGRRDYVGTEMLRPLDRNPGGATGAPLDQDRLARREPERVLD